MIFTTSNRAVYAAGPAHPTETTGFPLASHSLATGAGFQGEHLDVLIEAEPA